MSTWADRQGIKTGVQGEILDGIPIEEENRATVYEYFRAGIETLHKILIDNYVSKGVHAVLFGIHDGKGGIKYAVYVRPGFLRKVIEEDE